MEKLYGFKQKDVIGLAEFIQKRKGEPLLATFKAYGEYSGKAIGTVRNLYYALAKVANTDEEFRQEYLQGKSLPVGKIEYFKESDQKEIIKRILLMRADGFSIRKAVNIIAKEDAKLALRYQNKYRTAIKDEDYINGILQEIKEETGKEISVEIKRANASDKLEELKTAIDGLVGKISLDLREENQMLKERLSALETENIRLNALINQDEKSKSLAYFIKKDQAEFLQ